MPLNYNIQALPQLVDGGEAEEEAALSAEEEFDLSEVMAEEVATLLSKEEMLQQVRGCMQAIYTYSGRHLPASN
jgi:hypothetical protein